MSSIKEIQDKNAARGQNILKAFDPEIEKGGKLNHKYIRKEGSKYVYKEGEEKNDKKENLDNVITEVKKKLSSKDDRVGAIVEKNGEYNFFFPKKGEYKVGDTQKSDYAGDEKHMGKIVHIVEND
jgi:hypothetical protein